MQHGAHFISHQKQTGDAVYRRHGTVISIQRTINYV